MSLGESLGSYLGLPNKKDMEQLQEQVATQERLLSDNNITPETFVSSQARESKKVDDIQGTVQKRVPVRAFQHLYLRNQFIFRGVNVRADEMITRGYKILGDDEEGVKQCSELVTNSGGENLFWQFSINSVTKDTPILVKYTNNSIDIIEMSELYKDKEDSANIGRYSTQEVRDLQVMTDDGWKNIKYIFRHKINENIYKIRTGTGLAKVTHDHSLILNNKEVHSKDLKIGSNIDVVDIYDSTLLSDMKDVSNDLAWLYGFFVSDGTAGIYKNSKQWKITNKNRDFLEKAELIIKENYDKNAKIHWFGDIGDIRFSPSKNKEIFNWYLQNCYTSNRLKRIPKVILNASKHVKESFMEGYWTGDGAKYTTWEQSQYATDSFSLIAGIEYLAKSMGKSISLNSIKNKSNVYLISLRKSFEEKQINYRIEQLNSIFKSEFDKKEAMSDDEISMITEIPRRTISYYRSMNNIPSKYQRQIIYDDETSMFICYKDNHLNYLTKRKQDGVIEEIITEKYNDYVYDIATENHKFVAGVGGLLHHNTDVCGDGYLEKVPNKKGDKLMILKHINPLNFSYLTELDTNRIIIGPDKTPKAYMQMVYDENGKQERKEISKDRIAHLKFNSFADEFNGISSIQPVYNTAIRLMNMENAAAEAAVKTANPLIIGETTTKSPNELSKWSKVLSNISAKDQVFLPDGVSLKMLSPGLQNFSAYADYFLDAVVAALGVPKSILTGSSDSGSGNRSTVQVQSRHFYSVIRANQRYIEDLFNEIFEDYAERAGFTAPKLVFDDIAEDAAVSGQRAVDLYAAGLVTLEEARGIIGLDTSDSVTTELINKFNKGETSIDPYAEDKKADAKTFHPAEPGSPEGSQRGKKLKQKVNPDVPSVK